MATKEIIKDKQDKPAISKSLPEYRSNPVSIFCNIIAYALVEYHILVFETIDEETGFTTRLDEMRYYQITDFTDGEAGTFRSQHDLMYWKSTLPGFGWTNACQLFYDEQNGYIHIFDACDERIFRVSIGNNNINVFNEKWETAILRVCEFEVFVHDKIRNIYYGSKKDEDDEMANKIYAYQIPISKSPTFLLDISVIFPSINPPKLIVTSNSRYLIICNDNGSGYLDLKTMEFFEINCQWPSFSHALMGGSYDYKLDLHKICERMFGVDLSDLSDNIITLLAEYLSEYVYFPNEDANPKPIIDIIPSYYKEENYDLVLSDYNACLPKDMLMMLIQATGEMIHVFIK